MTRKIYIKIGYEPLMTIVTLVTQASEDSLPVYVAMALSLKGVSGPFW